MIIKFIKWLFGWGYVKQYCLCNINSGSGKICGRCGCQRKKLG